MECSVVNGPNKGDKFSISSDTNRWRIGRKTVCNISFVTDQTLSNIHGKVTHSEGKWIYEDL